MADQNTEKAHFRQIARLVHVDQWTPGITQTWTPSKVKRALLAHQDGHFDQSAQLVNSMLEDDEIPGAVEVAVNMIASADVRFANEDEPTPAAEAMENAWPRCVPVSQFAKMVFWSLWMETSVGVLDWSRDGGKWSCKLRALNPEFLYWDDGEKDERTGRYGVWKYQHRDGTETVTPGDGRWVLLGGERESCRHSSVRALGLTWLIKQYTLRDWARYNERHGLPIIKAKVPAFVDASDKAAFSSDVRTLGTDTTVNLPSHMDPGSGQNVGFDLELLEAQDQAWETFKQTVDRCDRKIKMHFIGSNTSELEGTAGSRATQDSGRAIAMQKAQERAARIADELREQVVRPILELSLGIKVKPEDMPEPRFLIESDEDLEKRARTLDLFAGSLNKFKTAHQKVSNLEQEAAQYGLKLEEQEPETPPDLQPGGPLPPNGPPGETPPEEQEQTSEHSHGEEHLDLLEMIGERDGFEAAQGFLDQLVEQSTRDAAALEKVSAERMASIIERSGSPKELYEALEQEATDAAPIELAGLFEKAMILSEMSGRFAVEEDL